MPILIQGAHNRRAVGPTEVLPPADGIASVSGTISDGSTITISGGGFGSGCDNVFFEDFSNVALSNGTVLTTANTNFDDDGSASNYDCKAISVSRSGSYAMNVWDESSATAGTYSAGKMSRDFPTDQSEVFISYAVINPTGKRMPGTTSSANTYASGSNWKPAWLLGRDDSDAVSSGKNDIVIPTLVNSRFSLTGNGIGNLKDGLPSNNPTWWTFGEWVRMTTWLKAGADADIDAGKVYFEGMSESGTRYEYTDNTTSIFGISKNRIKVPTPGSYTVGETVTGGTSGATGVIESTSATFITFEHGGSMDNDPVVKFISGEVLTGGTSGQAQTSTDALNHSSRHAWSEAGFAGWADTMSTGSEPHATDVQVLYDDIYIAHGPNASAVIELGDNAVYESCTIRAMCDYTSWSATSISATVRGADLNLAADTWVFITVAGTIADATPTRYSYKVV